MTEERLKTMSTTTRQAEIDAAIAAALEVNPAADYRELAAAANTTTSQVRPALRRLGLPAPRTERAALAGYAAGWDAAARASGNSAA